MEKKKKWKIGLLAALPPTLLASALFAIIVIVYRAVADMGDKRIRQKAQNYAALSDTATKHATVFFGDSITELCPLADIYASYIVRTGVQVCNRGISAECTASMLERLEDTVLSLQPRNLVMLMGVNDLNQGVSQEQITANIRQIIRLTKEKSPDTNIVLQAVYPVDPDRESLYEHFQLRGRENEKIRSLNEKLAALAVEETVSFVDVTDILADENGNLKKQYTYDGLHPNTQGYLAVSNQIIGYLE